MLEAPAAAAADTHKGVRAISLFGRCVGVHLRASDFARRADAAAPILQGLSPRNYTLDLFKDATRALDALLARPANDRPGAHAPGLELGGGTLGMGPQE